MMENEKSLSGWGDLRHLKDEESHPQRKLQTIVVAGDMEDCFLLEMIIKNIDPGKKVIPLTSSGDLLDLLETYMPDLLIMDLEMPCRKGAECLRIIRKTIDANELKIVAFSSSSRPSNRTIAMELGANDFLEMVRSLPVIKKQIHLLLSENLR